MVISSRLIGVVADDNGSDSNDIGNAINDNEVSMDYQYYYN